MKGRKRKRGRWRLFNTAVRVELTTWRCSLGSRAETRSQRTTSPLTCHTSHPPPPSHHQHSTATYPKSTRKGRQVSHVAATTHYGSAAVQLLGELTLLCLIVSLVACAALALMSVAQYSPRPSRRLCRKEMTIPLPLPTPSPEPPVLD